MAKKKNERRYGTIVRMSRFKKLNDFSCPYCKEIVPWENTYDIQVGMANIRCCGKPNCHTKAFQDVSTMVNTV